MQKSNKISTYIYRSKGIHSVTLTLPSEIEYHTNLKFHRPRISGLFRAATFVASKLSGKLYIPSELKKYIYIYLITTFTSSANPISLLF